VIASSGLPDKAERARKLLQEMLGEPLEPSIHVYNGVLDACSRVPGDEQQKESAFRIASEMFDAAHSSKHLRPDLLTYIRVFFACRNLENGEARSKAVREGYQRCCDHGFESHP